MDTQIKAARIKSLKRLVTQVPGEHMHELEEFILGLLPDEEAQFEADIREADQQSEEMAALQFEAAKKTVQ